MVEGSHDERTIKQTVHATVLVVGGWGAKRLEISNFLRRAESTNKGILFFMDADETGTKLESYLLSCLNHPEQAKFALLEEEMSSRGGKIGLEHAKPKAVLKALRQAGAIFLEEKPELGLTEQDLLDLGLKSDDHAPSRRAKLGEAFDLTAGNAKHLLAQLNFLGISREEIEAILDKTDLA